MSIGPDFADIDDHGELESVVLSAAVDGDETCRSRLPAVFGAFEEPYRTIAAVFIDQVRLGGFADRHTVRAALEGRPLHRRNQAGRTERLTAFQAVAMLADSGVAVRRAHAYLPLLAARLGKKRQADLRDRVMALAELHADQPARLRHELEAFKVRTSVDDEYPTESMKILPYLAELVRRQRGAAFTGLNSGFPLLNEKINGLDVGLYIVAAVPGAGKTTFAFQVAQQVAELNRVPVIFVSMEQSEIELRSKAIARLGRVNCLHVSRGGLRWDDLDAMARFRGGAERYFGFAPYFTIVEGDAKTDVEKIGAIAAAKMARLGADRCFIVVDYLQIVPVGLDHVHQGLSTKDRVDHQVSELRRLARRLNSPVLAISSLNRDSYEKSSMKGFKESGVIEYSADVAAVMTTVEADIQSTADYRMVEFDVLKNRNGPLAKLRFKFYAERAEFVENGLA